MKLGINQFSLLKRCYSNQKIRVSDVMTIYGTFHKRGYYHSYAKEKAICEKLVNRGYLEKRGEGRDYWWELTTKGKEIVEKGWV